MIDLSRIVAALMQAPGIVPSILDAVSPHVPAELQPEWDGVRATVLDASSTDNAQTAIVAGLTGALQAIVAGRGEVGPSHAHLG